MNAIYTVRRTAHTRNEFKSQISASIPSDAARSPTQPRARAGTEPKSTNLSILDVHTFSGEWRGHYHYTQTDTSPVIWCARNRCIHKKKPLNMCDCRAAKNLIRCSLLVHATKCEQYANLMRRWQRFSIFSGDRNEYIDFMINLFSFITVTSIWII